MAKNKNNKVEKLSKTFGIEAGSSCQLKRYKECFLLVFLVVLMFFYTNR